MQLKMWFIKTMIRFFGSNGFSKIYLKSEKSKAYGIFCEKVFGRNLCQFNMVDEEQLLKLLSLINATSGHRILDVGCGIGYFSEYIGATTGAKIIGVDFANGAIESAQKRTAAIKDKIEFQVANINNLPFSERSFDFIIAVDTLYFVNDLNQTIRDIQKLLKPNGRFLAFYTSKLSKNNNNNAEATELGKALREEGLSFQSWNFADNEIKIWERSLVVAEELKDQWIAEGNVEIYKSRVAEAKGCLEARKKSTVTRYLYYV